MSAKLRTWDDPCNRQVNVQSSGQCEIVSSTCTMQWSGQRARAIVRPTCTMQSSGQPILVNVHIWQDMKPLFKLRVTHPGVDYGECFGNWGSSSLLLQVVLSPTTTLLVLSIIFFVNLLCFWVCCPPIRLQRTFVYKNGLLGLASITDSVCNQNSGKKLHWQACKTIPRYMSSDLSFECVCGRVNL